MLARLKKNQNFRANFNHSLTYSFDLVKLFIRLTSASNLALKRSIDFYFNAGIFSDSISK